MKKIVCFLITLCMLTSLVSFSAYANMVDGMSTEYIQNTTDARDLQAYGLHTFSSFRVDVAPVMDGVISTGEYPALSDRATVGDGLWFTDSVGSGNVAADENYTDVVLETYLAFDDTYAYIAEQVTSPSKSIHVPSAGSTKFNSNNVRYGLSQSKLVPDAYSCLDNTYRYRRATYTDARLMARSNRRYVSLENGIAPANGLSLTASPFPYTDGEGAWNASRYVTADNAGVTMEGDGPYIYTFEYRIPLTEIAYSAFGALDETRTAQLVSSDEFYGSYSFSFVVNESTYLSTSIPGKSASDAFSGKDDKTWTAALKEFFTTEDGVSLEQDYLPSPLYHFNTGDPTSVSIPASSGFRSGSSVYGFDDVPTVFKMVNAAGEYKKGDYNKYFTYTLNAAGADNVNPYKGDVRVIPVQYRVRSGYTTKLSGGFAEFTKGVFDASKLPSGLYTLVVTFAEQKWDGAKWVDTGFTRNFSRNITIAGSTRAANASSQTGDDVLLIASVGVLVAAAALSGALLIVKKRRKTSI